MKITEEQFKREILYCLIEQDFFDINEYYEELEKLKDRPFFKYIVEQTLISTLNKLFEDLEEKGKWKTNGLIYGWT